MDSRLLMMLQVKVAGAQQFGTVAHGPRLTAPITDGHFEGPRLRGKVLPGGGDWTLLRGDGVLELDLRLTLETDDGALIHMTSFGVRHGPPEVLAALTRGERVEEGPGPWRFLRESRRWSGTPGLNRRPSPWQRGSPAFTILPDPPRISKTL